MMDGIPGICDTNRMSGSNPLVTRLVISAHDHFHNYSPYFLPLPVV